jgi:hypothetical protein
VQSFSDAIDTDDTLFDALVEFPPHTVPRIDIGDRYQMLNPRFRGEILDYEACVDAAEAQAQQRSDKVIFPGVMAAWDNTPRRRDLATIFANASPQAYGRWLTAACRRALAAPAADHRLVFINAWNEWAEGSYLEPDQRYGHAYLQATRDVLLDAAQGFPVANAAARARHLQAAASPQLLFVGHDAHRHGAQLLTLHLLRLFARRFGYRPRLWLLGDGALRPDYEAVAEVRLIEDGPDRLEEVASRLHAHGVARCHRQHRGQRRRPAGPGQRRPAHPGPHPRNAQAHLRARPGGQCPGRRHPCRPWPSLPLPPSSTPSAPWPRSPPSGRWSCPRASTRP